jgi:peptidoglycan/LPS O-acetylase OafA/YrhL
VEIIPRPDKATVLYRPEIDGLRAVAIAAVIANHFNKAWLTSGQLGVDLFFVISGFVITATLAHSDQFNFFHFYLAFLARRLRRLLPALLVFVAFTCLIAWLLYPDPGPMTGLGWRTLFGISNFWLHKEANDYFSTASEYNLFTHTWSLGVETQFYVLFPLLTWFSGFTRRQPFGRHRLGLILLGLAILSLIGFVQLYPSQRSTAYFLTPFRFWELAAGCMACLVISSIKRQEGDACGTDHRVLALRSIGALAVFVGLCSIFFLPSRLAIPATIGCVLLSSLLLIIFSLDYGRFNLAYKFLTLSALINIGRRSYSMYLWHWPVIAVSRWTIGIHGWTLPFQLGLIALLSYASFQWIEQPFRHIKWTSWRWLLHGLMASTGTALIIGIVGRNYSQKLYRGNLLLEQMENRIGSIEGSAISDRTCSWFQGSGPDLNSMASTFENCTMKPRGNIGQKNRLKHLYVIGDSFAANYVALMPMLSAGYGLAVTKVYVKAMPPPVFVVPTNYNRRLDVKAQYLITKQVLSSLKRGDIVLISRYMLAGAYTADWREQLEYFTKSANKRGAMVIVSLPLPAFNGNRTGQHESLTFCTVQWYRPRLLSGCYLSHARRNLEVQSQSIASELEHLTKTNKNLVLYNPFSVLCPKEQVVCTNYQYSRRTYDDGTHLNYLGSTLIASDFIKFLASRKLIH